MVTVQQQKKFLEKIIPMAQADMKSSGILASLTIAQAICESGWGLSGLTKVSNNLFGMKGSYNGNSVNYPTKEYINKAYVSVTAKFKAYANWEESIADHSALFNRLSRYENLRGLTDYKLACQYVREDGYATSPTYTTTLTSIIEAHKLYQYDSVSDVEEKPVVVIDRTNEHISVYANHIDGNNSVSANFKVKEFACQDGTDPVFIDSALVDVLQRIRDYFGCAVTITSGYRNVAHNKAVGGATYSQHIYGKAADIKVKGHSVDEVANVAERILENTGGVERCSTWTHVDVRADIWRKDAR